MQRIAVLGAGRMGRQIITAVAAQSDCKVSGVWSRDASAVAGIAGYADLPELLADSDIAIDFTLAAATSGTENAMKVFGAALRMAMAESG